MWSSWGFRCPFPEWSSIPNASMRLKSSLSERLIFYISSSFSNIIISEKHFRKKPSSDLDRILPIDMFYDWRREESSLLLKLCSFLRLSYIIISLVGPLYFGLSYRLSNSHESSSRRSRLGDRWPILLSKLFPGYLFFYFDIDLYFLELSCLLWVTSGIDSRFKDFYLGITFVKSLVLRHLSSKLS